MMLKSQGAVPWLFYLTLTSRQFLLNLADIYHYPNEDMRVSENFFKKKLKKFLAIT